MGDFGIRISKDGKNVLDPPTEATKKDFVFLSESNTLKVFYSGFIPTTGTPPTVSGSYTHNLGYIPLFFVFDADSPPSPTFFRAADVGGVATTTVIETQLVDNPYVIIFEEGS